MPIPAERSHTPKGRRARDRIVSAAERLFATAGFHGTSIRDVARAARLPLATTVYHFARKEQLYAAVLEDIGDELVRALDGDEPAAAWPVRLDAFARALVGWTSRNPERVRLLLRALLDNPARVARASKLPLAPFLAKSAAIVEAAAAAGAIRAAYPELVVLHLVGAASYVVAAWPTLERIVGAPRARRLAEANEDEALAFARTVLGLDGRSDATGATARAGAARARAPRTPHDGSRRRTDAAPRRRVPAR
ncbi:MAG: TetR/AcrR family transcriptional regulator [Deltaproteobacteria bacterium]|nr:TetR/AcrR family transcriptional regulator [Deltaproteobacteria bacterium]